MIAPPLTRESLSRILRIAARSSDAELAEYARAGLRRLGKAPTLPRREKRVTAIRKGRAS